MMCAGYMVEHPGSLAPRRAADPSVWITAHRRCARDYKRLPASHEAMVLWAMTALMNPAPRHKGATTRLITQLQKLNGWGLCLLDHSRRACVNCVAGGSTPEI